MGNIIDLVFTEDGGNIVVSNSTLGPYLSDLRMVNCILTLPRCDVETKQVTYRKISEINCDNLIDDLHLDSMEYDSLEDVMPKLGARMNLALDKHAPEVTKTPIVWNRYPWYNKEIKEQRGVVRRRENIWKHYKLESNWKAFKKEHSKYRRLHKDAKKMSTEEKVQDCKGDSKKLLQLVSNLTIATKQKSLPEYSDPKELANDFANFFINKIKKIRDVLDHHLTYKPTEVAVPKFAQFREMSEDEVLTIIKEMPAKSSKLVAWEASLVKRACHKIIRTITKLVNLSLVGEYLHHNGK